jgi:hypothetical protein
MELKTNEYRVWVEGSEVHFDGTMRLSGSEAYAPIQQMLEDVLATDPASITINLKDLEFLNSSGINLLAKFTIEVRKKATVGLVVKGSRGVPWQSKSLGNLKKLYPSVELSID